MKPMLPKLPPSSDFTEVAIIFENIDQAIYFLKNLVYTAQQQISGYENKEWPDSIYWNGSELHFYMDISWGTDPKTFYEEFIEDDPERILEVHTWYSGVDTGTYNPPQES